MVVYVKTDWLADKHYENMFNTIAIREMQIKTTMRYYFTSTRSAVANLSDLMDHRLATAALD